MTESVYLVYTVKNRSRDLVGVYRDELDATEVARELAYDYVNQDGENIQLGEDPAGREEIVCVTVFNGPSSRHYEVEERELRLTAEPPS